MEKVLLLNADFTYLCTVRWQRAVCLMKERTIKLERLAKKALNIFVFPLRFDGRYEYTDAAWYRWTPTE